MQWARIASCAGSAPGATTSAAPTTSPLSSEGNELKIVDIESGELAKAGEPGEICVKGAAVMRRYYKIDPATIFDDEGFFRTGDLGHLDDEGRLIFS